VKIAYVGGCHLVGYPIGANLAFPRLVSVALGASGHIVDFEVLQPVTAKHGSRIGGFVAEHRPDVVVLQLGNFETNLTTRSLVRRALGLRGEMKAKGSYDPDPTLDDGFAPQPDASLDSSDCPSAGNGVKLLAKTALHRLWLSHFVAGQMDRAARAARDASSAPVFALDPLPCADPTVELHRRAVRDALPERPQGYRREDFRPLISKGLGIATFADSVHLAAPGHRLVAECLVEVLLPLFREDSTLVQTAC
jgi:hypothetical protein